MDFAKDGRDSVGLFENDMIKTSVFFFGSIVFGIGKDQWPAYAIK